MNVAQICIDSGGHYTDEVYAFCRKQGADWAIPVKGSSQAGKPIATFPKTKNKKGVYLTLVGTDTAKELVYQRYRVLELGQGYCHWPIKDCFDEITSMITETEYQALKRAVLLRETRTVEFEGRLNTAALLKWKGDCKPSSEN